MNGRLGLGGLVIALAIGYLAYLALDTARDRSAGREPRASSDANAPGTSPPPYLAREELPVRVREGSGLEVARVRPERDSLPVDDWESTDPFAYDESETPNRERVKRAFVAAIEESFPDYRLSSDEVDRATDALVTLRTTQEALRALPFDPEHSEERRVLVETIGNATSEFGAVLGMDPADFTARAARTGGGVDFDDGPIDADGSIESEFLEPRR